MTETDNNVGQVVPLFGRAEMNLIEFPYGLLSRTAQQTIEVEHEAWDPKLRRKVFRTMLMTGSDKWGLPRPIDDRVLFALKTITHDSDFVSQIVEFTRYQVCGIVGWRPDGKVYARIEESMDRMKATTLKFKDGWWDKAEQRYRSRTFSILDNVDICTREELDRARLTNTEVRCSFRWSDVMWKSFKDGFIKEVDTRMYRKIAEGRRRDVPLRLFQILDKRFWHSNVATFKLKRLCIGTLGFSPNYSPAQMLRVLDRAVDWLIKCGYLEKWWSAPGRGDYVVYFRRRIQHVKSLSHGRSCEGRERIASDHALNVAPEQDKLREWMAEETDADLVHYEAEALENEFGTQFERKFVYSELGEGIPLRKGCRIRQEYVRRFAAGRGANRGQAFAVGE